MENQVIDNVEVSDEVFEVSLSDIKKTRKGKGKRDKAKIEAEVRLFFAKNPTVLKIGNLLAVQKGDKTLAEILVDEGSVRVPRIQLVDGTFLDPTNVQKLTLEKSNVERWGCIACHSAHGSGIGNAQSVGVSRLETNEFYYGVETRSLFTISDTCYGDYVQATGLHEQIVEEDMTPVKSTKKGGRR
jgi:hypothetical protein